jgi:hypothetical protein
MRVRLVWIVLAAAAAGCSSSGGHGGGGNPFGDGSVSMTGQPAVCAQLLSCAAVVAPDTVAMLIPTYGPDGTCWKGAADLRDTCTTACTSSLAAFEKANPNVAACACMGPGCPMPDLQMSTYPPGPYGTNVGEVIADFTTTGYRFTPTQTDPSQLMLVDLKLSDLHLNAACTCIILDEQAAFSAPDRLQTQDLIGAAGSDPSLCVLGLLFLNNSGADATTTDLTAWARQMMPDFPDGIASPAARMAVAYDPNTAAFPTAIVITPRDMKIVYVRVGYVAGLAATAKAACGGLGM